MKILLRNKLFAIIITILFYTLFTGYTFASSLDETTLNCKYDIVMDIDSENILYGKNIEEKLYPASTTKILTAILTIESLDLDKKVIVSDNAFNSTPYGSSVMGVKAGEIFTVEDLLYGLMLPSGNDAALVLAEAVSGNVNLFVKLMNDKIKDLELNNTHFTNPHGFHDDNHYSTAKDMAILFKYCLQNDTFKKIISTLEYELTPTNLTDKSRILRNTNRMCDPLYTDIYNENILAGKTGYTIEANGTFICYACKDDKNYIIGTFYGNQNINGKQGRFLDTAILLDYCSSNFSNKTILTSNDTKLKLYDKENDKYYIVGINDNFTGLVKNDSNTFINYDITTDFSTLYLLSTTEETSINTANIGNITIFDEDNNIINSLELKYLGSGDYYEKDYTNNYYLIIFAIILVLLIILIYISTKDSKTT